MHLLRAGLPPVSPLHSQGGTRQEKNHAKPGCCLRRDAFLKAFCDDPLKVAQSVFRKTFAVDLILIEAQVACSNVDRHVTDKTQRLRNALGACRKRHSLRKSDLEA